MAGNNKKNNNNNNNKSIQQKKQPITTKKSNVQPTNQKQQQTIKPKKVVEKELDDDKLKAMLQGLIDGEYEDEDDDQEDFSDFDEDVSDEQIDLMEFSEGEEEGEVEIFQEGNGQDQDDDEEEEIDQDDEEEDEEEEEEDEEIIKGEGMYEEDGEVLVGEENFDGQDDDEEEEEEEDDDFDEEDFDEEEIEMNEEEKAELKKVAEKMAEKDANALYTELMGEDLQKTFEDDYAGEEEEEEEEDSDFDEEEMEDEEYYQDMPEVIRPSKRLNMNVEITGNSFEGVANINDILKAQRAEGKKKPAPALRELEDHELEMETSDLEENVESNRDALNTVRDVQQNQKYSVNDTAGMLQKLNELKLLGKSVPWVHTLQITTKTPLAVKDIHDDFEREVSFYKQTLETVELCEKLCKENGLAIQRKPDFFAEMVKTDKHMFKVRAKLIEHKKRIETAEMIRHKRQVKRFGKQLQMEKQKEREVEKSKNMNAVKNWRKSRNDGEDFDIDLDYDSIYNDKSSGGAPGTKRKADDLRKKGKKRLAKDKKFGFGGKKDKSNTKDSALDFSDFKRSKNSSDVRKALQEKRDHRGPKSRPGKSKRSGGGSNGNKKR